MLKLFLAFTVIPAVELYLLILVGQYMGPLATVGVILTTGAIGAYLAKREGLSLLKQLEAEARQGFPSGDRIVEGLMVLVAGVLLVTPGVLTDITGFILVTPFTRRRIAPVLKNYLLKRFASGATSIRFGAGATVQEPPAEPPSSPPSHFDHPTPD